MKPKPDPAEPLCLRLFGGVSLSQGDRSFNRFPTARARELIAYLALHRSEPVPRAWLNRVLWPEVPPDMSRNRLSVALYGLRRAAAEAGIDLRPVLGSDRGSIWIVSGSLKTDAEDFWSCIEAGAAAGAPERTALFQRATDLYRGPLLVEVERAWSRAARESAEAAYREAVAWLLAEADREGDTAAARSLEARLARFLL